MVPPRKGYVTFMNLPLETDLDKFNAEVAIMGIPYSDPYTMDEMGAGQDQAYAPAAVRAESARAITRLNHWDFDLGGTIFDGKDIRAVDVGDVPGGS